MDTFIGRLSKGYRQRVGLAQAILHDPKVLILDEPTAGLDPKQIIETRALIKDLGGSHTVILSTHILPEVSVTCSRVLIINEGKLVAQDTPENLIRHLEGSDRVEVEVRDGSSGVANALQSVPHVLNVEDRSLDGRYVFRVECASGQDARERLAATIVQGGWGLLGMRRLTMNLEDVYLKLITTEAGEGEEAIDEAAPAGPAPRRTERRSRRR
jgi:ABC-2 type transport system ATP-binding protein